MLIEQRNSEVRARLPRLVEVDENKTSFENFVIVLLSQLHDCPTLNNNNTVVVRENVYNNSKNVKNHITNLGDTPMTICNSAFITSLHGLNASN